MAREDFRPRDGFKNKRWNDNNRPYKKFNRRPQVENEESMEAPKEDQEAEAKKNKLFSALKFLVRDVAYALTTDEGFVYTRDRRKLNIDFVHMLNKGLIDLLKERFPDYKDGGYCGVFAYIMAVCLKESYGVESFIVRSFSDDLDSDTFDVSNIKSKYQLDSMDFNKKLEHTYFGFIMENTVYIGDSFGIHTEHAIVKTQGKHKFSLPNGIVTKDTIETANKDKVIINYANSEASFIITSNKVSKDSDILLPYEKEILEVLPDATKEPKLYSEIWKSNKFRDEDFGFTLKQYF